MNDANENMPHVVGFEKCRECGKEVVGVVDARADLSALECSRCGKMTSEMAPPSEARS